MTIATGRRPSEARERLLRIASEIFYAEGIHDVGVDHILERAAVTRSTFYRHFPSKEDLVLAYLQAVDDASRAAVSEAAPAADSPANLLRTIARGLGAQICRPGFRGCAFINAAAEYPDPDSPVRRAILTHRDWLRSTVEDVFRQAGHADPETAARYFMMLRDGAMVAGYLHDAEQAVADLEQAVVELLPTPSARRPIAKS